MEHLPADLNPILFDKPPVPLLVVLSGPSGVGKDSVLMRMRELGFPFHFVVTATDRPQRPGERCWPLARRQSWKAAEACCRSKWSA